MADKVEDILMTPKQVAKRWWPEDKESVAITKFYKWRESIRAKGVEFPMVKLGVPYQGGKKPRFDWCK